MAEEGKIVSVTLTAEDTTTTHRVWYDKAGGLACLDHSRDDVRRQLTLAEFGGDVCPCIVAFRHLAVRARNTHTNTWWYKSWAGTRARLVPRPETDFARFERLLRRLRKGLKPRGLDWPRNCGDPPHPRDYRLRLFQELWRRGHSVALVVDETYQDRPPRLTGPRWKHRFQWARPFGLRPSLEMDISCHRGQLIEPNYEATIQVAPSSVWWPVDVFKDHFEESVYWGAEVAEYLVLREWHERWQRRETEARRFGRFYRRSQVHARRRFLLKAMALLGRYSPHSHPSLQRIIDTGGHPAEELREYSLHPREAAATAKALKEFQKSQRKAERVTHS